MALAETQRIDAPQHILLDGQEVQWQLVRSKLAKKMRIKVGPDGVQVVLPEGRNSREAAAFIADHRDWVAEQLERVRQLLALRRPAKRSDGRVLFRGEAVAVRVIPDQSWRAPNKVTLGDGVITITTGPGCRASVNRSLENWLRKQARLRFEQHMAVVGQSLKRSPNRIYVMCQRTKWGNCSALGNLSFNWRLIQAPDHVLNYVVAHEMTHLMIPDHSQRFWLAVQSICPNSERARQWLAANGHRLTDPLPTF